MSRYISEHLDRKGTTSQRFKFELIIHDLQCQGPANGSYQVVWTRELRRAMINIADIITCRN